MPVFSIFREQRTFQGTFIQIPGKIKKIRTYGKLNSLFVIFALGLTFFLEQIVEIHKLFLLSGIQMINAIMLTEKTNKLQRRVLMVKGFHLLFGDIQDDPVMAGIVIRNRFCHVDQIAVDQNQIAPGCNKVTVIKKEKPFTFQYVENFIFFMKMLYTHIEFSITDHMFQRKSAGGGIISYFFQKNTSFAVIS